EVIAGGTPADSAGGTGHNSYAVGDLLYANGAASLTRLAGGSNGQFVQGTDALSRPQWHAVSVHWTDITSAPIARRSVGSNGQFMRSNGSVMYWDSVSAGDIGAAPAVHTHSNISINTGAGLTGGGNLGGNLTLGIDSAVVQLVSDPIALSRLVYTSHPMGWVIRANGSAWAPGQIQFSDIEGDLSAEQITGGTLLAVRGGT